MKSITRSLGDETYRRCCAHAEAAGRSVEEMVGSWLSDWSGEPAVSDAEQECARQELHDIIASIQARRQAGGEVFRVADSPTREQLHDCDALR